MIRGFIGGVLWGCGLAALALAVLSQVTVPPSGQALVPVAADGPVAVAVAREEAAKAGQGGAAAPEAEAPAPAPGPAPAAPEPVAELPTVKAARADGTADGAADETVDGAAGGATAPGPVVAPAAEGGSPPVSPTDATGPVADASAVAPAPGAAAPPLPTAAQPGTLAYAAPVPPAQPVAAPAPGAAPPSIPPLVQTDAPALAQVGLTVAAAAPAPAVLPDPVPTRTVPAPPPAPAPDIAPHEAPPRETPASVLSRPPRPQIEAPPPLPASSGPVVVALPALAVPSRPAMVPTPVRPAAVSPDTVPLGAAVLPRPVQPATPPVLPDAPGAAANLPALPHAAPHPALPAVPLSPEGAAADAPPPDAPAPAPAPAPVAADSRPAEARPSRLVPDAALGGVGGTARTNRLPRIIGPAAEPDPAPPAAGPVLIEAEGSEDRPAIERHARAFQNPAGKPVFSIVLIDDGDPALDRRSLAAMPFPVTFVLDPSRPESALAASIYREGGQEVAMLATGLPAGATAADLEVTFAAYGDVLPEAVAIVDVEDGGFQGNRAMATMVAPIAAGQGRGLLSWDRGLNAAEQVARREGLRSGVIYRRLDGEGEGAGTMRRYLDRAAFKAAQDGRVIVAGVTRPETVAALLEWAVEGRATTVALAPLSAALVAE